MALDSSKLQVSVAEGARWRRTLEITVPTSEVQAEQSRLLREVSGRARIPGFRSGKVPQGVLEKRFGSAVRQEALDRIMNEAFRAVLESHELRPINEADVDEVRAEPETDLFFRISFDVSPVVELTNLGGFSVERPAVQVTDADVDRVIERLREERGSWADAADEGQTPMVGDLVSVSITNRSAEGSEPREYDLVLGSGEAIPEVEDAIRTLTPGAAADFVVHFPEDFPEEARRGEEQELHILLRARQTRVLPALDDDFARSLGDFESMEALRARILEDLNSQAEAEAETTVRGAILDAVIEANPFELPESMILNYVRSLLNEEKPAPARLAQMRAALGDQAEIAVKRILVIERLADTQGLRATEDELDVRIEEIATRNGSSPAEVYARFQKSGRLDSLERELTESKVFQFLYGQSEVVPAA